LGWVKPSPKPSPSGYKKQNTVAKKLLLHSLEARICAALRAMSGSGKVVTHSDVLARATKLSVWKPLPEPIQVVWRKKDKGGFRPIVVSGPMRTAQSLMVRDMLLMMDIDSSIDCTQKRKWRRKAPDIECLQRHRERNQLVVDP
jgi:hypothetical protein